MSKAEQILAMVEPLAAAEGAAVYDVTLTGDKLVVALTRSTGVDLSLLTSVTRQLNELLEEHDPVAGSYVLEVTSPGLERPLRTAAHFRGAIGDAVTIRTLPDRSGPRRVKGVIVEADDDSCTVEVDEATGDLSVGDRHVVVYGQVERARTLFVWGDAPKPGAGKSGNRPGSGPASKKPKSGAAAKKTPATAKRTGTNQSVKKSGKASAPAAQRPDASPDQKAPST